jgi:hypothetical protein
MPQGAYNLSDVKPIGAYSLSDIGPAAVSAEDFAPTNLPYKGQRVPGDTFADKLRNAASVLGGEALGMVKGAAHSAINLGEMAANGGILGLMPTGLSDPMFDRARAATAYSDDPAQRFGGGLETAAEFAAPAVDVARLGLTAAEAAQALLRAAPAAIGKAGPLAADVLSEALPFGRVARRLLGHVLDSALSKTAAPAAEKAALDLSAVDLPAGWSVPRGAAADAPAALMPTGGWSMPAVDAPPAPPAADGPVPRLVKTPAPTINDALIAGLEDTRTPEPPARVTTPPPADLPPGYTPRTSAPKPKAAPKAPDSVAEPVDEPAKTVPNTRAYFLKPEAVIKAEKAAKAARAARPPAPKADVTVADLPASWQARVGQDLFPVTGDEGKAMLAGLQEEMATRGLTPGQAITAVSKNRTLPTQVRAQLIRALSQTGAAK